MQAEPLELDLFDPHSPRVQWANCVSHSIALAYGLTDSSQWRAGRGFYDKIARRLMGLYGKGIPSTDIGPILRGEIPWPR